MKEDKLKALVIDKDPVRKNWGIVNVTELTEDGKWHCGLNLITSIEDAVERAEKENVPIITRKYLETKIMKKQ